MEETAVVDFAGVDKDRGNCRGGVDFAGMDNDGVVDSEFQL